MTLDVTFYKRSSQLNGNVVPIAEGSPLKSTVSYATLATVPACDATANASERCIVLFYANGAAFTITWVGSTGSKTEQIPSGVERWRDVSQTQSWTIV